MLGWNWIESCLSMVESETLSSWNMEMGKNFVKNLSKNLSWPFGLIFIFGGLSEFSSNNFIFGLSGILLGLSFLPIFWSFLNKKFNLSPSIFKKAGVVFVLMLLFGYFAPPAEKVSQTLLQNSLAPTSEATTTAEKQVRVSEVEIGQVTRVVDGDTLEVLVDDQTMKIRVIGINTPETVDPRKSVECFGQQASSEAKRLLENQQVRLETDPTQGDKDKYDRYLRFVWLENGNFDYGKQMIANGFAFEYTYQTPYKYQAEYKLAQQTAETEKKGLWADDACMIPATPTPSPAASVVSTSSPKATPKPTISPKINPSPKPTTSVKSNNSVSPNSGGSAGRSCSGPDLDCKDFATHAEAQAFFNGCGFTATNDPMKLDGTGVDDGIACESLP